MPLTELALRNAVAGYAGATVLENVDLSVKRGERVGIIGRNGAGKTTTLATAMGLTQQIRGQVLLNGADVSNMPTAERSRRGLGYVPQTRDIFKSMTVRDNLRTGLQGGPDALLEEAYALFPRLHERRNNFGNELSGGEQQMLSIARALMGQPDILLLDEPLEGLAPVVAQELMASLSTFSSQRGLGCVLVEQHVGLVLDFASSILLLERGRTTFWGSTAELKKRPELLASAIGLKSNASASAPASRSADPQLV
jgi:branched-chain amino acid transport system ATP-binding protein